MITFHEIISTSTHYGIIWSGTYNKEDCIIKMVILNTGIHYNKKADNYYDNTKNISKPKCFNKDNNKPFLHTYYQKRKAMNLSTFHHEITMLEKMSTLKLAHKLFHHWIDNQTYPAHYGFIVMERMTKTVKDILLKRDLKPYELSYLEEKIADMHKAHIKHGDLKPSNIGVHVNESGYITKMRMIDWAKGASTRDKSLFDRDTRTFYAHIKKNISER